MKNIFIRGSIISIILIIIFFVIYSKYFKKNQILIKEKQKDKVELNEKNFNNSNIIKDIEYSSKDLEGNEYKIFAKEGEIDINNTDTIYLKNVTAYIKILKNNETISISSNFGRYNTFNYDTIFSKNVKINYIDNKITGEYLDFSMINNLLIISKNVVYTNPKNILKADVIEINTINKDTKIFMYSLNDRVEIEGKN